MYYLDKVLENVPKSQEPTPEQVAEALTEVQNGLSLHQLRKRSLGRSVLHFNYAFLYNARMDYINKTIMEIVECPRPDINPDAPTVNIAPDAACNFFDDEDAA